MLTPFAETTERNENLCLVFIVLRAECLDVIKLVHKNIFEDQQTFFANCLNAS